MPKSSRYVLREILGKGVTSTCFSCTRAADANGKANGSGSSNGSGKPTVYACKVIDRKKLALQGMSTASVGGAATGLTFSSRSPRAAPYYQRILQ